MASDPLITQIAVQGFSGLLANLASSYFQRTGRKIKQNQEDIKRDLKDHLESTFRKCTKLKTILNHEESVEALSIYVDQTFNIGGQRIDQYSLIDRIRAGTSFVLIGEGGGGKSMFMRYLWLSFFEKSDGKIPFFLELRNLNNLKHTNFKDFIFHSIIKSGSSIRQDDFNEALKAGEFVLFLDGFDEINFDKRDFIQEMLLDLKASTPNITIVVTSRSDERFFGWDAFSQAAVLPMDGRQARMVIERANYNPEMKQKFLGKFDELYKNHTDFLSNPLLAYMMLVTFAFNPDIPKRMFLFYEQAFEALYHRHDLTKGYKRTFHCQLDKFDFLRLVSYFCLGTYTDEDLEFTRHELLEAIEKARKIENYQISPEDFLSDLVQSVCILKLEGLTYTFTHRSFQEYFAAHCIARVAVRNVDRLFAKLSNRPSDRVLPMAAGINPDLVREKYIIPNVERFPYSASSEIKGVAQFMSRINAQFNIRLYAPSARGKRKSSKKGILDHSISFNSGGDFSEFFWVAVSIVSANEHVQVVHKKNDLDFVREAQNLLGIDSFPIRITSDGERIVVSCLGTTPMNFNDTRNELVLAFADSGMAEFIEHRARIFVDFINQEVGRHNQIGSAFDEFF